MSKDKPRKTPGNRGKEANRRANLSEPQKAARRERERLGNARRRAAKKEKEKKEKKEKEEKEEEERRSSGL